jgi:lipid A 3-O-deacylase
MQIRFVLAAWGMLAAGGAWVHAEPPLWESMGVRGAFSGTSYNDPFRQYEMYTSLSLPDYCPWACENSLGWFAQTRLDFSAGWLTGQHEGGFVGTAGPGFTFGRRGIPVFLDLGVAPTVLSRFQFGTTDFGCHFQFTSHAGFLFKFGEHLTLGYRFQHMSNASLSRHNPGLDLNSFAAGYRF